PRRARAPGAACRPSAWALLGLLLALGAARPAPAAPGAEAPPARAVDAALERALAWLAAEQRPDGAFGTGSLDEALGSTLLAALALQHAGAREDGGTAADRALARALALADRLGPGRARVPDVDPGTYTTSLLALVLRARGREADRPRMQRLRDLLLRTQARNGQWGYRGEPGTSGRGGPESGDHSNLQFALLALGALAAEGADVAPEPLARARAWVLAAQRPDGGFGYGSGGSTASAPSGSMTAAGIANLALVEALAGREDPLARAAIERALAWLSDGWRIDRNPGPAPGTPGERQRNAGRGWLHYWLWTLERACVLAGHERVGGHDWYAEGATHLLGAQRDDGSWVGEAPLYATCFALLFLTRAADPPRVFTQRPRTLGEVTPRTGPAGEAPLPAPAGAADPRAQPPLAPDVLLARARAEGPAALERLLRALEDPDPAVRQRAHEALAALLEPALLAGVAERALPRNRLALWVRRHRHALVLEGGRFVLPAR
ncbi:MAG: hypothetical protein ACKOSS_12260, partial [Planctomycetia bacterium]